MNDTAPTGDPVLPPELPDGTWLHLPDLHGPGYLDVLRRDDTAAYTDPERITHREHWFSYHRRAWLDWGDAVRLGAASERAQQLIGPIPLPAAAGAQS